MWVMTRRGFVSAVADGGQIKVRARTKQHLTDVLALAKVKAKVEVTPGRDYRYRAFLSRTEFKKLMAALADDVTYGNFKSSVPRGKYEKRLHDVWDVMGELQPLGPVRLAQVGRCCVSAGSG